MEMANKSDGWMERLDILEEAVRYLEREFSGCEQLQWRCDRLRDYLKNLRDRAKLGLSHTIVSLVGGTGSGKSSIFNCLTNSTHADVGVLRPTTQEPASAVWKNSLREEKNRDRASESINNNEYLFSETKLVSDGEEKILDHLGVSNERRIVIRDEGDSSFAGVVIIDLPDHDSLRIENAQYVEKIAPLSDVLVWVVDPQKFADPGSYLSLLDHRRKATVVVVNHQDLLSRQELRAVVKELREIIDANNLHEVLVITSSARDNDGISAIREEILEANLGNSAQSSFAEQVEYLEAQVKDLLASERQLLSTTATENATVDILEASGAGAINQTLLRNLIKGAQITQVLQLPSFHIIDSIKQKFITELTNDYPSHWQEKIASYPAKTAKFERKIKRSLSTVSYASVSGFMPRILKLLLVIWILIIFSGVIVTFYSFWLGAIIFLVACVLIGLTLISYWIWRRVIRKRVSYYQDELAKNIRKTVLDNWLLPIEETIYSRPQL